MEGNLRFKIDWASLIVGSKFTIFVSFYVVFEGNFPRQAPSTSPQGGACLVQAPRGLIIFIWRGLYMEGLIFRILRYFILPCCIAFAL